MIPFKNRFHGHNSLSFVYKNGKSVRSRFFNLKYINNQNRKNSRLVVVVSKKVIKSAVKRNRIRRRVYEVLRHQIENIAATHDLVIIILSSEVLEAPHQDLKNQVNQLFTEAGITK